MVDANTLYPPLPTKEMEKFRQLAVNDFVSFIRLVAPFQQMGHCHEDLCKWIQSNEGTYKLILWPRDHGKSCYAAFYVAWQIVRNPAISIIYASATADLAKKMLTYVKSKILEQEKFKTYFPNILDSEEGKREKWTTEEIIVDHPLRNELGSSNPTIKTIGVGGNMTGYHCDLMVLDDVVIEKNTLREGESGREKVNSWIGAMASILSADNDVLVVGTRYHPSDAYQNMIDETYEVFDEEGELLEVKSTYVVNQADVEQDGQFLWPRKLYNNGKRYGFDKNTLAKKKATYVNNGQITQFYAQYYNDPNDRSTAPIARDLFRYYDKAALDENGGFWSIDGDILSIFCAVDLAATLGTKSDYTAICIGGIKEDGTKYLLEAIRYKTDKVSETIDRLQLLYSKWKFKRLRIEAVGAFSMIAKDVAVQLERRGVRIPIDIYNPGSLHKEVRMTNILEPAYQSQSVFHYRGGMAEVLEDEVISLRPPHDDLKDSWAMCIDPDFMKPTIKRRQFSRTNVLKFNKKYGGVDYT